MSLAGLGTIAVGGGVHGASLDDDATAGVVEGAEVEQEEKKKKKKKGKSDRAKKWKERLVSMLFVHWITKRFP